MMENMSIRELEIWNLLNLLKKAQYKLALEDYINIWGDDLGKHIWRQEGSDIIKIWGSGITQEQQKKLVQYISNEKFM